MTKVGTIADKDNGFVKARGLPFDCTLKDVANFFEGYDMEGAGVYRSYYRDRPDG